MDQTTRIPPMEKSDEAKYLELDMARAQGEKYVKALEHMANEVADDGGETRAGDYIIAYAIEGPEGMYHLEDGKLAWQEPEGKNIHVEVSVRDGADHRFIPALTVYATLTGPDGKEVGRHQQPFLWHPWLYHYGRNWKVPTEGDYTLKVEIEAPEFMRHDKKNGKRFSERVEVEFKRVKIKPKKPK